MNNNYDYKSMLDDMFKRITDTIDLLISDETNEKIGKTLLENGVIKEKDIEYGGYYHIKSLDTRTLGDCDYIGFEWGSWYRVKTYEKRDIDTNNFLVFAHDDYIIQKLPMSLISMTDEEILQWLVVKETEYCLQQKEKQRAIKKVEIADLERRLKQLKKDE